MDVYEALIDLSQQYKLSLTEEHRIECYETIEKALKTYEKIIATYPIKNGKEYKKTVVKRLLAIEILRECFYINGFDEFIPNSKWYDEKNENKRKLIEEVFYEQK